MFLGILAFLVPRFVEIYKDYGIPPSRLMSLVFGASDLVARSYEPLVTIPLLLLIVLGADWLMQNAESKRGEQGWALAWSMMMFAAPVLLIALTVMALIHPFFYIMRSLSG